jgi:hypothetical protein
MEILRPFRHAVMALLLCTMPAMLSQAYGQEEGNSALYEQKIKAGLVYNFLKYTVWPKDLLSEQQDHLNVCLYGDDAFDGYLFPLEGRTAQKFIISILRIDRISEIDRCHLLFIPRSQEDSLSELLPILKNKPLLTVSDIKNFARKGGMVELAKENDYINMYVNRKILNQAGLEIQDRFLKLAKLVSN